MDANRGTEGHYEFPGDDDLMSRSPVRVVKAFMEYVDREKLPHDHVDYEIYSALKNDKHHVVTCMGSLILPHGDIPFLLMISPKPNGPRLQNR